MRSHEPANRRTTAFTLVELLVVIGIIALLISILLPALGRVQDASKRTACMNNHRQLIAAVRMYCDEFKDVIPFCNSDGVETKGPPPVGWTGQPGWLYLAPNKTKTDDVKTGVLYKYVKTTAVYHCPFEAQTPSYPLQNLSSYLMNREVLMDTKFGPLPSWKLSKFRNNDILFWEVADYDFVTGKAVPSGYWNDGANLPTEGITTRHAGSGRKDPKSSGAIVGCFGGNAEIMTVNDFNKEAAIVGGRVQCGPPNRKFQRF